ncbi:hypothetical protein DH2020_002851 [Rehmannia glutinosa]|uniref:Glycerol-3-phosphate dehydrogenase NAD-dependent N-terminal domain-containing protein n=1 Tax=Rehmannia glutinosa TaxID=99300 RepID=A0ABR0XVI0_REHGL
MEGNNEGFADGNVHINGSIRSVNGSLEEKIDEIRGLFGKTNGDPLRIVGVGAGAWGSVFTAMLQDAYGIYRDKVQIRIWRRAGRSVDRATAEHLFEVVTNLQEAVWDADIVINGLPSTETWEVFEEISRYWKERITAPVIISLAKGIEAELEPEPRIVTPTQMINRANSASILLSLYKDRKRMLHALKTPLFSSLQQSLPKHASYFCSYFDLLPSVTKLKFMEPGHATVLRGDLAFYDKLIRIHLLYPVVSLCIVLYEYLSLFLMYASIFSAGIPMENILYLGGPNIASEIYNREYANARICGAEKWRKPLARFLRQPHFTVWDNGDLVTHEVMGGLKNVYAIGAGRNAWYGHKLAKGEINLDMGDSIKGKGMIQGVSAVKAFYELLSQSRLNVPHPNGNKHIAPVELCPILQTLYKILIVRELSSEGILQALRDETMNDPRERIEIAQRYAIYRPSLLIK